MKKFSPRSSHASEVPVADVKQSRRLSSNAVLFIEDGVQEVGHSRLGTNSSLCKESGRNCLDILSVCIGVELA